MFTGSNNLNEGRVENPKRKVRQTRLTEGKNLKPSAIKYEVSGWETNKLHSRVNSNWEKLRK